MLRKSFEDCRGFNHLMIRGSGLGRIISDMILVSRTIKLISPKVREVDAEEGLIHCQIVYCKKIYDDVWGRLVELNPP